MIQNLSKSENYQKKKKDIYANRRRKAVKSCFQRLEKIVDESNVKDCDKIIFYLNKLWWKINEEKHLIDDFLPKGGELNDNPRRDSAIKRVKPVIRYVCPVCKKPGYEFAAQMRLEPKSLKRCMIHFSIEDVSLKRMEKFSSELKDSFRICELPPLKGDLTVISGVPDEGFFTYT